MQRIRGLIVVVCAALIAACSPATAPTASPAASSSPAASAASAVTTAPTSVTPAQEQPTATPLPETAASSPTNMPPAPRGLTLWYGYAENSPEEQALRALVERARPSVAGAEITLLRVPGAELINRFETEAAAGGGPDLLLAANDNLGRDVRAGLLHSLDSAALDTRDAASLESMRVDGKLYGLPLTYSTIALYSNTARVTTPPATTQALLDAVKSGAKAVFIRSAYHNFGLFGAFGGRLLDEGGRCVADQGGFTEALAYMRELKAAGAQFVPSGREAQELFRSGQADLTIDGDWLLADFRASLGDQLGVAPLPAGPAGPARPLVASSGFFVSANSRQAENATALALALTDEQAQQQISSQTQLIPSSPQITPADAAQAALASSARNGVPRPQRPELDAFWQPFDAALGDVLETDVDPAQAVQAACAAMNSANGK